MSCSVSHTPPPPYMSLQGVPEDLLFFYQSLQQGGGMVRVDRCLLVYRYHENAATHSVTESVLTPPHHHHLAIHTHTRAHILRHSVDPPPTHSCPLASTIFSTWDSHTNVHTHTDADACFHNLEIPWMFLPFPSLSQHMSQEFQTVFQCGMFRISPTPLGGSQTLCFCLCQW